MYPLVIRAGGGSPRDTLSVLDQLLAGADGNQVAYQRALALLGATDVALIDEAVDALAAGDAAALFGAVEAVIDAGHDPRRFATDLLERFRDLIVLQAVPDAVARGVVDGPEDVLERMREQADTARVRPRWPATPRWCTPGSAEMRGATAPRLLLEVVCARLLLPLGQRHRIGAAAAHRAHRDPAGHVDPAGEAAAVPAALRAPRRAVRPAQQPGARPTACQPSRLPRSLAAACPRPSAARLRRTGAAARAAIVAARTGSPNRRPSPPATRRAGAAEPVRLRPSPAGCRRPVVDCAAAAVTAASPTPAAVRSMWTTVREKVRQRSRTTEVMLAGAIVRAGRGRHPCAQPRVRAAGEAAHRTAQRPTSSGRRSRMRSGVDWKIRCEVGTPACAGRRAGAGAAAAPSCRRRATSTTRKACWPKPAATPPKCRAATRRKSRWSYFQNELGARRIDGGQA